MAKVLRKPQAESDLIEIWSYIALDNLEAADRLLDVIDDKALTLAESPLIGRERKELLPGIRSFAIGNYVLFYQQIENGIEIIRVLHGARDVEAIFNE